MGQSLKDVSGYTTLLYNITDSSSPMFGQTKYIKPIAGLIKKRTGQSMKFLRGATELNKIGFEKIVRVAFKGDKAKLIADAAKKGIRVWWDDLGKMHYKLRSVEGEVTPKLDPILRASKGGWSKNANKI
jgi:hypothetical protein